MRYWNTYGMAVGKPLQLLSLLGHSTHMLLVLSIYRLRQQARWNTVIKPESEYVNCDWITSISSVFQVFGDSEALPKCEGKICFWQSEILPGHHTFNSSNHWTYGSSLACFEGNAHYLAVPNCSQPLNRFRAGLPAEKPVDTTPAIPNDFAISAPLLKVALNWNQKDIQGLLCCWQ